MRSIVGYFITYFCPPNPPILGGEEFKVPQITPNVDERPRVGARRKGPREDGVTGASQGYVFKIWVSAPIVDRVKSPIIPFGSQSAAITETLIFS